MSLYTASIVSMCIIVILFLNWKLGDIVYREKEKSENDVNY